MFSERSRYYGTKTTQVTLEDGREVTVLVIQPRPRPALLGYHRREEGQRLDHIASHYLKNPTGFWKLCDANGAMSPHALEARELIGIPRKER